ncbi:MAG: SIMPL domain-containing protein [Candidatus Accumulibacter sp.]|jgi:uncharacterized protein YggE|nr:SIMPL domain-containing protein [Accumulibacter sp.]
MKRLLFVPFLALFAASTAQAQFQGFYENRIPEKPKPTLTVDADAEILVRPDRLNVDFAIEIRSKDLKTAKERVSRIMRDAIAFCKARGVQEKYIQTNNIRISPRYRHDDERDRIVMQYYELFQGMSLTLDLDAVGKYDEIVFGLLDRGVNIIGNPKFSTTELRKHRDAARLAAIKAAQEKAKLLTDAAGIVLGNPVDIAEKQRGGYYPMWGQERNFSQNMSQNISQQMPMAASESSDESGGAAPGMISVKAGVTITYELGKP